MPVWTLAGPILLALTAQAGGDRVAKDQASKIALSVTEGSPRERYRMPLMQAAEPIVPTPLRTRADYAERYRDRRFDRPDLADSRPAVGDPVADCLKTLLRDRTARRGGGIDAKVVWHVTSAGNAGVGLGGGLVKAVENLLRD